MDTVTWTTVDPYRVVAPELDEEADRYRLLAFRRNVLAQYASHRIYPHLERLAASVANLQQLLEGLATIRQATGELQGFDLAALRLVHSHAPEPDAIRRLRERMDRALPLLQDLQRTGDELHAELSAGIHVEPVGILPLYTAEGYLLLRQADQAVVYSYALLLTGDTTTTHHRLRTRYVTSCTIDLAHTYDGIKAELVRCYRNLPNPATFAVESDRPLPRLETLMPLAKMQVLGLIRR